jgi:hypothetical protein
MPKERVLEEKPACAIILIHYLADSAVNLEVRERALEFVAGVLKRSPDAVSRCGLPMRFSGSREEMKIWNMKLRIR